MTDSPGKKQFLLRISDDLHTEIKSAADESNISMSAWITMAVRHWLDMEPAGALKEVQDRTKANWWME
jgi:hypothetical protein